MTTLASVATSDLVGVLNSAYYTKLSLFSNLHDVIVILLWQVLALSQSPRCS